MAKAACIKKDLKKLGNEIDDLIMLEDSAHGTLCAIHKTIHSTDNFPCSRHKMLRLCPVPKSCIVSPHTRIPISRSRKKFRSSSPCYDRPKMLRTLSANDPHRKHYCGAPHSHYKMENKRPQYCDSNYINVEKTISCPEKMCGNNGSPNKTCTITSRSTIHIDKFSENALNTDEVVNELKGEIEKVKHQLQHISQQKLSCSGKTKLPCLVKAPVAIEDKNDAQMTKLKTENRRLKRELEAKRRLLEKSRNDVTKAKDILTDYEKKVSLLHLQALKSSKAMKLSKEKFCSCLREKDEKIKSLKESNGILKKLVEQNSTALNEKEAESQLLNENIAHLKRSYEETCEKCNMLSSTNQNFMESIDMLRNEVLNSSTEINTHKETIQTLEKKIQELNCLCKRVVSKTKKQKENYQTAIKTNEEEQAKMSKQISELSIKLEQAEQQKKMADELQCRCKELQKKIVEYELFSEKCKVLEEECKNEHKKMISAQEAFEKEKQEMEKLIDELTTVVKENKVTIMQMTEINKHQQNVINSQSVALMTKEEQLKLVEKESDTFKKKTERLEQEMEQLKRSVSEPCSKEACLCISKELADIKNVLNIEKDTQLMKEKIIQDQSQTILNLQSQVKEKMSELSRAQSDTRYLEEEIGKINEKLMRKHQELDAEVDEKESLIEKLRTLECQKNQLSEEISDFEEMLHHYKETCGNNEKQQLILKGLEEQIAQQKKEWDMQKEVMAKEKNKAVCAAKFATQKLLDTVENFQRQVDAQKKVQILLTKMLHDKDEQLRIVQSKIYNINNITRDANTPDTRDSSMKQLFFRNTTENITLCSDQNTNTSMYSSCSSCCKRPECLLKASRVIKGDKSTCGANTDACRASCANVREVINLLSGNAIQIKEEPDRDIT